MDEQRLASPRYSASGVRHRRVEREGRVELRGALAQHRLDQVTGRALAKRRVADRRRSMPSPSAAPRWMMNTKRRSEAARAKAMRERERRQAARPSDLRGRARNDA